MVWRPFLPTNRSTLRSGMCQDNGYYHAASPHRSSLSNTPSRFDGHVLPQCHKVEWSCCKVLYFAKKLSNGTLICLFFRLTLAILSATSEFSCKYTYVAIFCLKPHFMHVNFFIAALYGCDSKMLFSYLDMASDLLIGCIYIVL